MIEQVDHLSFVKGKHSIRAFNKDTSIKLPTVIFQRVSAME